MSRVAQISKPSQTNGHPSCHGNNSISFTASGSARGKQGRTKHPSPAVESAVTRLLVSIKQLLEALTLWSQLRMDEEGVSNVYVRLGNDFNSAVAAFAQFNIEMNELLSVPEDLRNVLEQCLAEEATPEHLELYLPTVRQIITNLLQGLRGKQSIYRRIVSDHRHRSGNSDADRAGDRASRSSASGRHRSQGSQQGVPANVTRSNSLVDKPVEKPPNRTPTISAEPSSPQYATNGTASPPPPETPPIERSLAAFRFSMYNISKMTGATTTRERSLRGSNHPNPRSRDGSGNIDAKWMDGRDSPSSVPATSSNQDQHHKNVDRSVRFFKPLSYKPRMDLHEDKEKNLVTATFEFPGISKDDIQINVHNGCLIVSAETKQSSNFEKNGYTVRERQFGKFSRTLQLPRGIKDEKIKASMANGILTVTFPRMVPEPTPKRISIS